MQRGIQEAPWRFGAVQRTPRACPHGRARAWRGRGHRSISTALWTPAKISKLVRPEPMAAQKPARALLSRAYPSIKITGMANLCEKVFYESMGRALLPRGLPLSKCLIANRRLDSAAPILRHFLSIKLERLTLYNKDVYLAQICGKL